MSAPQALDLHTQHVNEYLQTVLSGKLTAHDVLIALDLMDPSGYGEYWQARRIHAAALQAANIATAQGHGLDPITVTDVNAVLLDSGELTNDGFKSIWINFVSPKDTPPNLSKTRLPELARRISEDYFRLLHSQTYQDAHSMTAPLPELAQAMDQARQKLLAAYRRATRPQTVQIVGKGDVA